MHATFGYGYRQKRMTRIDSWACYPHSTWSSITCEAKNLNPEIRRNPIIYNSIRIWHDMSKYLGRKNMKSLLSPISQNPDFSAGVISSLFLLWQDKGIHVIADLFKDNTLLSFQQLQETFNISKLWVFTDCICPYWRSLQWCGEIYFRTPEKTFYSIILFSSLSLCHIPFT